MYTSCHVTNIQLSLMNNPNYICFTLNFTQNHNQNICQHQYVGITEIMSRIETVFHKNLSSTKQFNTVMCVDLEHVISIYSSLTSASNHLVNNLIHVFIVRLKPTKTRVELEHQQYFASITR